MRKRGWFLLLILTLLCLFAGCEKTEEPVETFKPVSQPPALIVTVPEGQVQKSSYYYSWKYLQPDGTEGGVACMPGMRADWWNKTADLETGAQTAVLSFDLPADEIDITRYDVNDGSNVSWDITEDRSIALSEGRWTYEIIAQWTDESRDYHGWGKYIICIEKK